MKPLVKYISESEAVGMVGKGWEKLVRKVYNAKEGMGIPVGIIQVKEKFGGLRIYTDYYVKEIEDIIIEAGKESFTTCEECGSSGTLMKRDDWYRTRCDLHREDFIPIDN